MSARPQATQEQLDEFGTRWDSPDFLTTKGAILHRLGYGGTQADDIISTPWNRVPDDWKQDLWNCWRINYCECLD